MYLKRYSIGALLFAIILGWFIYAFVTQGSYSLTLFGVDLPALPIALLVVLPIVVFYFVSLFHMVYYSIVGSFKLRKYQKDYERILDAISDAFLYKDSRVYEYKTDRYKTLGKIVAKSKIMPTVELQETGHEKLDALLKIINDIREGQVCDLKKLNLDSKNPLYIANLKNMIKTGALKVDDIVQNSIKYDESIVQDAFLEYVKSINKNQILKYKDLLTQESFAIIINRLGSEENPLELEISDIMILLKELDLNEKEYLNLTKNLKGKITPDNRLKLFELLSEENEVANDVAMDAYLYTLLDLEMLSNAIEILENTQEDEFLNYKAYITLKECSKPYDLELFIK